MPWDDSGNAFLHGTGLTLAVLDPDGTPNTILDEPVGGSCTVGWSFNGPGAPLLNSTVFTVDLYAGAIGPGPDKHVGATILPGSNHTATGGYSVTIPILPSSLPANGPGVSGVYRLTAVITNSVAGVRDAISGFIDGPVIEMRSP